MHANLLSLFKRQSAFSYDSLAGAEKDTDSVSHTDSCEHTNAPKSLLPYVLPWVTSTFVFAWLAFYFYLQSLPVGSEKFSFKTGWRTDFAAARISISTEEVKFMGSPSFAPNTTYYVPNPDPIKYNADPSPEVDRAWEELSWGRYVTLTKAEAIEAFGEQYGDVEQFWSPLRGGYISGFDMFHTLHCLDRIRRRFYPEYYPYEDTYVHHTHHLHCLDQIRQYVMCAGDMTPIPTVYHPVLKHSYVDSDVKHTCRNFGMLRDWLSERYNGSLAVDPICPRGRPSLREALQVAYLRSRAGSLKSLKWDMIKTFDQYWLFVIVAIVGRSPGRLNTGTALTACASAIFLV